MKSQTANLLLATAPPSTNQDDVALRVHIYAGELFLLPEVTHEVVVEELGEAVCLSPLEPCRLHESVLVVVRERDERWVALH